MYRLVFRVRKQYFDAIMAGKKTIEYRRNIGFWRKRIANIKKVYGVEISPSRIVFPAPSEVVAVFISGKRVHKREVLIIELIKTPDFFSDQGKRDVDTFTCWAFHLGKQVS